MPNRALVRLMVGFRQFREKFYLGEDPTYGRLATGGQGPKTLIIGCSDSRVDPAILVTSARPRRIICCPKCLRTWCLLTKPAAVFTVSAPRSSSPSSICKWKTSSFSAIASACGGIRALLFPEEVQAGGFLQRWVQALSPAKDHTPALKAVIWYSQSRRS